MKKKITQKKSTKSFFLKFVTTECVDSQKLTVNGFYIFVVVYFKHDAVTDDAFNYMISLSTLDDQQVGDLRK